MEATRTSKAVAIATTVVIIALIVMSLRGGSSTTNVIETDNAVSEAASATTPTLRASEIYTIRTAEEVKHDQLMAELDMYEETLTHINSERFVSNGWQRSVRPGDSRSAMDIDSSLDRLETLRAAIDKMEPAQQNAPEAVNFRTRVESYMLEDTKLQLEYAERNTSIVAVRSFLKYSELLGKTPGDFGHTVDQIKALATKCAKYYVEDSGPYTGLTIESGIIEEAMKTIREFGLNPKTLKLSDADKATLQAYLY